MGRKETERENKTESVWDKECERQTNKQRVADRKTETCAHHRVTRVRVRDGVRRESREHTCAQTREACACSCVRACACHLIIPQVGFIQRARIPIHPQMCTREACLVSVHCATHTVGHLPRLLIPCSDTFCTFNRREFKEELHRNYSRNQVEFSRYREGREGREDTEGGGRRGGRRTEEEEEEGVKSN